MNLVLSNPQDIIGAHRRAGREEEREGERGGRNREEEERVDRCFDKCPSLGRFGSDNGWNHVPVVSAAKRN
jgi:hypothetical protein